MPGTEVDEYYRELQSKSPLELFRELWYNSLTPTLWCPKYAHPFHRVCPVKLNYENLPMPFQKVASEVEHIGKTGDTVHMAPEKCFGCQENIRNGGICDPV